ncbi:NADH dehydrogenase subunit D [Thermosphaera chiliense]|uniref:NADH dehydrogenase subunit D n=2 Tax=Thermosphaera chiliense TaxID=3402707 RepID=A0A7M1USU8_9CREN|nr:NADH dehydrogenase subunit D [Thermosphaera aggregans]
MEGSGYQVVYFGPQHPGVPGNIAYKLWLDGDRVVKAEVVPGFLHRGFEKMMENRTWEMNVAMSYRFCVEDPDHLEIAYSLAVEDIYKAEIPENAKWLRMIQAEMGRIASHLFWSHFIGGSIGLRTPAYWAVAAREEILKWFARISGHRVYHNLSVPGGIRYSLPENFKEETTRVVEFVEEKARDVEEALLGNSIFKARLKGLGKLSIEDALNLGVTGPVLRASGLRYDLRVHAPYLNYDKVRFEVPVGASGDSYDRAVVRFKEIHQSLSIIRQALDEVRPGESLRVKLGLTAPVGEGVARVESARGEYMIHIISQGGRKPYRVRLRSMSMPLLTTVVDHIVSREEVTIADFPVILASLDPCPPDLDR